MRKYELDDNKLEIRPQGPYYIASEVDARIAELERLLDVERRAVAAGHQHADVAVRWEAEANKLGDLLKDARVLMRDLWRLEGEPSEELAQRCKAFMGGG